MSKKCCGIIYSDNDKVCKICGKPLTDDEKDLDIEDITAMVDKITKEAESIGNEKKVEKTEEKVKEETEEEVGEEAEEEVGEEIEEEAYGDSDAYDETTEETETLTENEAHDDVTEEKKSPKADAPAKTKEKDVSGNTPEISATVEETLSNKKQKDKASKGIKVAGVLFMTLSIVGLALVGLCVYSMVFNPYYDKNDEHFPLDYPEISSASDAYEMSEKLELMTDTDASATDAVTDDATNTDAEEGE